MRQLDINVDRAHCGGSARRCSQVYLLLVAMVETGLGIGPGLGCGHAKQTDAQNAQSAKDENPGTEEQKKAADSSDETAKSQTSGDKPTSRGRRDGMVRVSRAPDETPLATTPAGLLKPNAVKQIQDKLVAQGHLAADHREGALDPETRKALREFQAKQDLPATGIPDDATVGKLGLSPADMFRASEPKQEPQTSDRTSDKNPTKQPKPAE